MPDKKKIIELETATALNNLDYMPLTQDNGDDTRTTRKTAVNALGEKLLNGIDYTTMLETASKKPIGAINELQDFIIGQLPVVEVSGSIASFNTSLALPLVSLKANITAQQEGTGTPSPQNERSISGFSSVRLWQVSNYAEYFKGLLTGTYGFVDLSTLTWTTTSWGAYRATPDNCKAVSNSDTANVISENYTATTYNNQNTNKPNNSISVASTANLYIVSDSSPSGYMIYELATPITPTITTEQFNTLCQAFGISGDAITIDLGQTVYGGVLDCKNGTATITHRRVDLGSLSWNIGSGGAARFVSTIASIPPKSSGNIICDCYQTSTNTAIYAGSVDKAIAIHTTGAIWVRDTDYETADAFKTAMDGKYAVYELATPITLSGLTPDNFTAIAGQNNIFADSGDVEVEYYNTVSEVKGTLTAGATSITLQDANISTRSTIDVYTENGTEWNSVTVATGSVTITFDAQASDLAVKVRVS